MTNTTTDPATIVQLPAEHLACAECGVAARPGATVKVDAIATENVTPSGRTIGNWQSEATMTRCPDCERVFAVAAAIVEESGPSFHRTLGTPRGAAVDLVAAAMSALVLMGAGQPFLRPEALASEVRLLAGPSVAIRWARRFAPVWKRGADPATCAAFPWAAVPPEAMERVRLAYTDVLAQRVAALAPDVLVPPPPVVLDGHSTPIEGACLMCGVTAVAMPAVAVLRAGGSNVAARQVWTARRTSAKALGGPLSPEPINGHTCPACDTAIDANGGACGVDAIDHALAALLGLTSGWQPFRTDGQIGWAGLVTRQARRGEPAPQPNPEPFAHLDLAAVAKGHAR